jgi:prepilin-type N-terminal cleavage/methylation domain-containing protein
MPTSGCCRPERSRRGLTLLEMVVVLAIVSLLAALAGPQLHRAYAAAVAQTQRDGILAQLAGLSQRANALGVQFSLEAETASSLLPDGRPLVALPGGWRLFTEQAIRFNFAGICSGGQVRLYGPDGTQDDVVLDPPACEVRGANGPAGRL